jgi:FKBP-type peptidyl-prolyl cis-trans isomerase
MRGARRIGALLLLACLGAQAQDPRAGEPAAAAPPDSPVAMALKAASDAGIVVTDLKVGKGTVAIAPGRTKVHYIGWLNDPAAKDGKGRQFDSSYSREQPFVFPLGSGKVIKGWDLGVAGMQIGGKRRLVIPPELAYGVRGAGDIIPRNATLVFEIELLGFTAD